MRNASLAARMRALAELPSGRNADDLNADGPEVQRFPLGDERHSRGVVTVVAPGGGTAASLQVVGDDSTGCALTVTAQPNEDNPGADAQPSLVARVTWGQGGASHLAELDVGTGFVQSFWGSALQLSFFNEDPAAVGAQVKNLLRIAASISYLPQVFPNAVRTRRALALPAASAVVFDAPPFSIDVAVQSTLVGGSVLIELLSLTGVVLSALATGVPTGPLPFVNGTRRVRITNTSGVPQDISAIFTLAF